MSSEGGSDFGQPIWCNSHLSILVGSKILTYIDGKQKKEFSISVPTNKILVLTNKKKLITTTTSGEKDNFKITYAILSYDDNGNITADALNKEIITEGSDRYRSRMFVMGRYSEDFIYAIAYGAHGNGSTIEKWKVNGDSLVFDSYKSVTGLNFSLYAWNNFNYKYIPEYDAITATDVNYTYDTLIKASTGEILWQIKIDKSTSNAKPNLNRLLCEEKTTESRAVFDINSNKAYVLNIGSSIIAQIDMLTGAGVNITLTVPSTFTDTSKIIIDAIGKSPYREQELYCVLRYNKSRTYFATIDLNTNQLIIKNTIPQPHSYTGISSNGIDVCNFKGRFRTVMIRYDDVSSTISPQLSYIDLSLPHIELPETRNLYGISAENLEAYKQGNVLTLLK